MKQDRIEDARTVPTSKRISYYGRLHFRKVFRPFLNSKLYLPRCPKSRNKRRIYPNELLSILSSVFCLLYYNTIPVVLNSWRWYGMNNFICIIMSLMGVPLAYWMSPVKLSGRRDMMLGVRLRGL